MWEALTALFAVAALLMREYLGAQAAQKRKQVRRERDEQALRQAVAERDVSAVAARIDELRRQAAREGVSARQQRDGDASGR